jgi:hypothetical protein
MPPDSTAVEPSQAADPTPDPQEVSAPAKHRRYQDRLLVRKIHEELAGADQAVEIV